MNNEKQKLNFNFM